MPYSPIMLVHIAGGSVGLLSGAAAIVFRKGSPRHVLAGRIFVVAMLVMAAFAAYIAYVKNQPSNVGGGIFTFYLILTAWLTARRRPGQTSRFDWLLMLVPVALGVLSWTAGIRILRNGHTSENGVPVGMTFFIGTVLLLAAVGDLRMLLGGGVSGSRRIARHLWRMCFGLFIASGSFFLGPNNRPLRLLTNVGIGQHLPAALFSLGIYLILSIAPLVLLIFWLLRVRFSSLYKRQPQRASA
jgi:uncharacterized membrane protein